MNPPVIEKKLVELIKSIKLEKAAPIQVGGLPPPPEKFFFAKKAPKSPPVVNPNKVASSL